jgi:uncharacterized membrane protein
VSDVSTVHIVMSVVAEGSSGTVLEQWVAGSARNSSAIRATASFSTVALLHGIGYLVTQSVG